jgi:gluconokinase
LSNAPQPLILAIDIGSSSVRAALYDTQANLLPKTSVKIEREFTPTVDGGSELDADEAFSQVVAAIDAVLEKTKTRKNETSHVAACAFWHSLLGVDARGKPTTKVLGWADTRSREYSAVLKKRFDEGVVHNRTGAHFHSSFWPAKLLWLRKEFPDVFARTAKWLSFSDYVSLKLFAEPVASVSMASGTGIFDQRKCDWDAELLRYLKVGRDKLPAITDTDHRTFRLKPKFAKRWPRLKDAAWFPAVADGAADNIGSGCVTKDRAALMVATSAAMRVAYKGEPPARIPNGLWCYRIDRERVVVGGALSDGGNLYQKFSSEFKPPKNAEDEMRMRGAVANGLTVLPFYFGERSTGYRENAVGAIIGPTDSHDVVDILQAAMESVAYRLAEIYDRLKIVAKISDIVASGGALRESPVWTQIIADVLGHDLSLSEPQESSSRGAVLLALESIGKIESIERFPTPRSVLLEHHPQCNAAYKAARKQHQALYKKAQKQS